MFNEFEIPEITLKELVLSLVFSPLILLEIMLSPDTERTGYFIDSLID